MLARSALRTIQPLKSRVLVRRGYASEAASKGTSSNTAIYAGIAAALGGGIGGGYYYLSSQRNTHPTSSGIKKSAPTDEKIAPHPRAEEQNVSSIASQSTPTAVFRGGDQGWIDLKLEKVEQVNHNTERFRFALPNPDDISGLKVASAILVKYQGPGQEKPVIRPYTPISDEDAKGYVDLLVKRYPNGAMSQHLHSMSPEQRLAFKGPIPKYGWTANKHEHIGLIAGGTGITPMYQLIRTIFNNPDDHTKVTLVFGNTSEEDILLKHELHELENTYPQRFRAFYVLAHPPDGADRPDNWLGSRGRIDRELLKTVLPEPGPAAIVTTGAGDDGRGGANEKIKLFVCGPPDFYRSISGPKKSPSDQGDLQGLLKELGYSKDQVYKF